MQTSSAAAQAPVIATGNPFAVLGNANPVVQAYDANFPPLNGSQDLEAVALLAHFHGSEPQAEDAASLVATEEMARQDPKKKDAQKPASLVVSEDAARIVAEHVAKQVAGKGNKKANTEKVIPQAKKVQRTRTLEDEKLNKAADRFSNNLDWKEGDASDKTRYSLLLPCGAKHLVYPSTIGNFIRKVDEDCEALRDGYSGTTPEGHMQLLENGFIGFLEGTMKMGTDLAEETWDRAVDCLPPKSKPTYLGKDTKVVRQTAVTAEKKEEVKPTILLTTGRFKAALYLLIIEHAIKGNDENVEAFWGEKDSEWEGICRQVNDDNIDKPRAKKAKTAPADADADAPAVLGEAAGQISKLAMENSTPTLVLKLGEAETLATWIKAALAIKAGMPEGLREAAENMSVKNEESKKRKAAQCKKTKAANKKQKIEAAKAAAKDAEDSSDEEKVDEDKVDESSDSD